jgi:hypothetical protein
MWVNTREFEGSWFVVRGSWFVVRGSWFDACPPLADSIFNISLSEQPKYRTTEMPNNQNTEQPNNRITKLPKLPNRMEKVAE